MPQVKLTADGKYLLATLKIPPGLIVEGDMLGNIATLKFADHNSIDEKKFPEMERENYLCTKIILGTQEILLEPQMWETKLERSWILNLLEIPHFG